MAETLPVSLPTWAATSLLGLLRQSFTGNFTMNMTNGQIASVEYSQGHCIHCGSKKRMRVTNQR